MWLTTKSQNKVKSALLLDVVVSKGAPILKLLSCENQALLVRRDALLVLNFGLDLINRVGCLDFKSDGLSSEGFHEDLHVDLRG